MRGLPGLEVSCPPWGLEEKVWRALPASCSVLCGLLTSQNPAYLLSMEEKKNKGINACLKFACMVDTHGWN